MYIVEFWPTTTTIIIPRFGPEIAVLPCRKTTINDRRKTVTPLLLSMDQQSWTKGTLAIIAGDKSPSTPA